MIHPLTKDQPNILFLEHNNIGFVELNRPHVLNALSIEMTLSLYKKLEEWKKKDSIHAVILHSNSKRAFCAGGDLKAVHTAGIQGNFNELATLFRQEYTLNILIKTYPKPYISFIDGIAMGAGIGLAIHGAYRLLSENALMAMPETKIGFFPDIGASYFLHRAPGKIGLYLGLTGDHMQAGDALYANFGTHYVPHDQQQHLFANLKELNIKNPQTIHHLIKAYTKPYPPSSLREQQGEINTLFAGKTPLEIFKALAQSPSIFAQRTLETLKKRSPTSLAVTFEQLKRSKKMDNISDILSMEFNMAQNFIQKPDFFEGIRSVVIEKNTSPKWSPDCLEKISEDNIAWYFRQNRSSLLYKTKELHCMKK